MSLSLRDSARPFEERAARYEPPAVKVSAGLLSGRRVRSPVDGVHPGGMRDLEQARTVEVHGVGLAVGVVVESPDERDLRPVGRPHWMVAALGVGIGVRASAGRSWLDVDLA